MLAAAPTLFGADGTWLWWLAGFSVVMFVASLLGLPWLVAALPGDFFSREDRWVPAWSRHHPVLRWVVRLTKDFAGLVLIVAGIAMLALPGQGILTLAVGLMLLEFPGKPRLVRWLGRRRRVRRGLNWIRTKMHKPHFTTTPAPENPDRA